MLADQIASYTRNLLDDPNYVFLSNATLGSFLNRAESEYRKHIPDEAFAVTYQPAALVGAATLSLDGSLFGASATQPRCQRILRVLVVDATTGALVTVMEPASSFESLAPTVSLAATALVGYSARWWLDGRTLRFSVPVTGTIQIVYLPDSSVDWYAAAYPHRDTWSFAVGGAGAVAGTATLWINGAAYPYTIAPGDAPAAIRNALVAAAAADPLYLVASFGVSTLTATERATPPSGVPYAVSVTISPATYTVTTTHAVGGAYVDDFDQFHDVIALLAAQQYAGKDGATNGKIDELLMLRLRQMDDFFAQTRSGQGSRYVRDDGWWG